MGLSREGFEQAKALARYFRTTTLEGVYSSPLKRSLQTARIIASPHHLKVRVMEELTGVDVGSWVGRLGDQLVPGQRHLYGSLGRFDEGEWFQDVMKRTGNAVREIRRNTHGKALIVSHGDPIAAALCQIFGIRHQKIPVFHPDTASISAVLFDSKNPHLAFFNHTLDFSNLFK